MDKEQLENRVEWLDDERRKDKKKLTTLQKRIDKIEGLLDKSSAHVQEMTSEITRLSVLVAKVDEFDSVLNTHRTEVKREMDNQEKRLKRRETDAKRKRNKEIETVNKTVEEFRQEMDSVSKLREEVLASKENEMRLNRLMNELREKMKEFDDSRTERTQAFRSLEDDRRMDNKRVTDLQGEVSAIRKRSDEHGGKLELISAGQKKADVRLNELIATEIERRETQSAFMEKVNAETAARERIWKDWNKRFDKFQEQSTQFAEYLQSVGETERAVKQAQSAFDEITDQINRRISEITEMQRLGEERSRQEWATFKADDQKRWTNHTLTQEEQQRELRRRVERLSDHTTNLDDNFQELQDIVQHISEQAEKRMQTFLAAYRDWVAENERFFSSVR